MYTLENACNICGGETVLIFEAMMLNKYKVSYYQCGHCAFIQTEKPYWLSESYNSALTALDVGLVYRNMLFSKILPDILDQFSTEQDTYIDYGGGYGMFVRMMRDIGYRFYLQDLYAENMYAKHFELSDYKEQKKFACLTTFEVFEHLEDPVHELGKMFQLSDTIIFSTELQPAGSFSTADSWWYFVPEVGQHISFYSLHALQILSDKYSCDLYTNGTNMHMLTKTKMHHDPFIITPPKPANLLMRIWNKLQKPAKQQEPKPAAVERTSLLQADFDLYRSILNKSS